MNKKEAARISRQKSRDKKRWLNALHDCIEQEKYGDSDLCRLCQVSKNIYKANEKPKFPVKFRRNSVCEKCIVTKYYESIGKYKFGMPTTPCAFVLYNELPHAPKPFNMRVPIRSRIKKIIKAIEDGIL